MASHILLMKLKQFIIQHQTLTYTQLQFQAILKVTQDLVKILELIKTNPTILFIKSC